jgi:hypothetical protein
MRMSISMSALASRAETGGGAFDLLYRRGSAEREKPVKSLLYPCGRALELDNGPGMELASAMLPRNNPVLTVAIPAL